jgi:hypothetical protein
MHVFQKPIGQLPSILGGVLHSPKVLHGPGDHFPGISRILGKVLGEARVDDVPENQLVPLNGAIGHRHKLPLEGVMGGVEGFSAPVPETSKEVGCYFLCLRSLAASSI